MEPNELAAMLALPMAARVEYEHEGGWSFATHSNGVQAENYRTLFDETQMRAYALAHIVAERERCAKLCDDLDNDENSGEYRMAAHWAACRIRGA